jgi:hypothetical protein
MKKVMGAQSLDPTSNAVSLPRAFAIFSLALLLGLCAMGCQSTPSGPAPGSLASVMITNHSLAEIAAATEAVFARNGFRKVGGAANQMTFERPGSGMDNLAYATWMSKGVTVRAVVSLLEQADGSSILACDPQLVEDAGDPFFEDKHKVRRASKGLYQDMMKEIAVQLK